MVPRIKGKRKNIQEGPLDTVEATSITETVVEVEEEKIETETTRNGMNGNLLALAEEVDHRMNTVITAPVVKHKVDPEGKNLLDTTLKDLQK